MDDEFDLCLVLNTRMAARAVTRRADRKLRPFGVTATQFNILAALQKRPARSVTEMAETLAMERTTLSRNLDLVERKGLITTHGAEHGNGRVGSLTPKGEELVDAIVPVWRQSQQELRSGLDEDALQGLIATLRHLAKD